MGYFYQNYLVATKKLINHQRIGNYLFPLGISSPNEPNISSTRWRTVADQKNLVYYFDNILNPNVVWVEFSKIDCCDKGKIRKLSLDNNEPFLVNDPMDFKNAQPFKFAGLE
jgi:choloylglycine hydrolase